MADYFLMAELQDLAGPDGASATLAMRQLLEIQATLDSEFPLPEELVEAERLRVLFDIFLSYRSTDAVAVLGLYHWLTRRHYQVYLDSLDVSLPHPSQVNRQTADVLRKRMVQSRSLFVVTTQNTPTSMWVPWELGFTDGLTSKAAVLYIADPANLTFHRQSYFELYAEVQRDNRLSKPSDLHLLDPLARPPLNCDWGTWLAIPKRY